MATVNAGAAPGQATVINLANAQSGTGDTTNVGDRGRSHKINGTKVRVSPIIGATPTCTYSIQVSADNVTFAAATYADVSTPNTDVATTFALTGTAVVEKIVKHP